MVSLNKLWNDHALQAKSLIVHANSLYTLALSTFRPFLILTSAVRFRAQTFSMGRNYQIPFFAFLRSSATRFTLMYSLYRLGLQSLLVFPEDTHKPQPDIASQPRKPGSRYELQENPASTHGAISIAVVLVLGC